MEIITFDKIEKICLLPNKLVNDIDINILQHDRSFWLEDTDPVPDSKGQFYAYICDNGLIDQACVYTEQALRPCLKVKNIDLSKIDVGDCAWLYAYYYYIGDSYFLKFTDIGLWAYNFKNEKCTYDKSNVKKELEKYLSDLKKTSDPFVVSVDGVPFNQAGEIPYLKEKIQEYLGKYKNIELINMITGQRVLFKQ